MGDSAHTKRVELDDGRWADVRRITVGDIAAARTNKHDRGWDDDELDAIFLLPRVVVACSEGDVTETFINGLSEKEYALVWVTAKGADVPNPSSPSSNGSTRRGAARKGRSSG